MTEGSGSCPKLPNEVHATNRRTLVVTTVEWVPPGEDGCLANLSATTSTIAVPKVIDDTSAVTVVVDGTNIHLAPRPVT